MQGSNTGTDSNGSRPAAAAAASGALPALDAAPPLAGESTSHPPCHPRRTRHCWIHINCVVEDAPLHVVLVAWRGMASLID